MSNVAFVLKNEVVTRNLDAHLHANVPQLISYTEAKHAHREWRVADGFAPDAPIHTQPSDNFKLKKSAIATLGCTLSQGASSGMLVCDCMTFGCMIGCLGPNGNGGYPKTQQARISKTRFFAANPDAFITLVDHELFVAERKYEELADRLNVLQDLRWERWARWLFDAHPNVHFYDYTKDWTRLELPENYHLTYSATEHTTDEQIIDRVSMDRNVAVVFGQSKREELPKEYLGIRVIDGDAADDRFNDPLGVIVGLRAKGRMRKDTTGFVRRIAA